MTTPLAWFGLPHDADERELKRSYAKRLKEARPDVDPEGFQVLREKYEAAMAWCRHRPAVAMPGAQLDHGKAEARFDVDAFVSAYLQVCAHDDTAQLQRWLQDQPALWSLRHKHTAGHALMQRLFADPPPMAEGSFDATQEFFHLDQARSAFDPLRMRQLRETMQERLTAQRRAEAMVQDWGAAPESFDADAFYVWFCLSAMESSSGQLEILLQAQPALRSLTLRRQAAPLLLERLCRERPPMPSEAFELLSRVFRFSDHAHDIERWQSSLEELPYELEIQWLTLPRQLVKLSAYTYVPGKPYAEVLRTKRSMYWASKPFRWWWVLCICLMPGLPRNLGFFFWRLSGGKLSRLAYRFDPRMVQFFLRAGDPARITAPRLFVGGIRCTVPLALAVGCDLLLPNKATLGDSARWGLTFVASVCTLGWVGFMSMLALTRWQAQPEEPVTRLPGLRLAFIPLLTVPLLAWTLVSGATLAGESLMLALAWLAYARFRARRPPNEAPRSGKSMLAAGVTALLALIVVPLSITPALGAITLWMADALKHGSRLRFRRPVSATTD